MRYRLHSRVYALIVLLSAILFATFTFAQATNKQQPIPSKPHADAKKHTIAVKKPLLQNVHTNKTSQLFTPIPKRNDDNKAKHTVAVKKSLPKNIHAEKTSKLTPITKPTDDNKEKHIVAVKKSLPKNIHADKTSKLTPILKATDDNKEKHIVAVKKSQPKNIHADKTSKLTPISKPTDDNKEKHTLAVKKSLPKNIHADKTEKHPDVKKPLIENALAVNSNSLPTPVTNLNDDSKEKLTEAIKIPLTQDVLSTKTIKLQLPIPEVNEDNKENQTVAIKKSPPKNIHAKTEKHTDSVNRSLIHRLAARTVKLLRPVTTFNHDKKENQHAIIKQPLIQDAHADITDTLFKDAHDEKKSVMPIKPLQQVAQANTTTQPIAPHAKPLHPVHQSKPRVPVMKPESIVTQKDVKTTSVTQDVKTTSTATTPATDDEASTSPTSTVKETTTVTQTKSTAEPKNGRKLWNLKDVDIRTFIHTVSEETGKNFVIDPRVTGKVTFISAQPLNLDELYQAFLSVLQVNGFVALPDDKVIKIVPDYIAKGLSSPIYSDRKQGDAMAVTVVAVRFVPANELSGVLNQFVTPSGHIAAYSPSNHLIVADRAGNIRNLLRLIKDIDQQRSGKIELVHLHNASAKQLVDTLKSVLERKSNTPGVFSSMSEVTLAADERTNSVLISGGSVEQRKQVRSIIESLDTSNNAPTSTTEVIYLKHLHAERAAPIVNGIIQNYYGKLEKGQTTSTTTTTTDMGGGPGQSAASSSLFNTTMAGGSSNTQGGMSTMYSTGSGFYTSNSPTNDIGTIVEKLPKSGALSPYVQWEESTNSLVVTAPHDLMRKIKEVINRLDIRRPQVLIEAVIAEVSEERQKELGIQWNPNGTVSFQTNFLPVLPLSIIGLDGRLATGAAQDTVGQGISVAYHGNQIRLLISALEEDNTSNVLATPNLVTLDNEPAQIKIGAKVPFATAQIQNNPTGGNPFNFFNREDVGLVLTIAPQIAPNGAIKLLIQQELSAILPGAAGVAGNPTTSERFIRTTVMADNGQILVLGGLLQNQWDEQIQRVPWLGNLPLVGALFRDKNKRITKTNLMIFLRPTIMYDRADEERVSGGKYEFLRQTQLKVDRHNPFYHHYETPVLPKEIDLPPPFGDLFPGYVGEG